MAMTLAYHGPRSLRSAIAQGRRRMSSSPNEREEIEIRMNRKERRRLASHAEGGLVAYGIDQVDQWRSAVSSIKKLAT
jgi:hypothetical protein